MGGRAVPGQGVLQSCHTADRANDLKIIPLISHDLDPQDGSTTAALTPRVQFTTHTGARGEPFVVPDRLWRLDPADAFATVTLPSHLYWSGPSRPFVMRNRQDRARVYEIVLREGTESDLLTYVDGALLIDLWNALVLPPQIRSAWEPLMTRLESST